MLRVVRRLPVEDLRALTDLRLGAGILQPLTTPDLHGRPVDGNFAATPDLYTPPSYVGCVQDTIFTSVEARDLDPLASGPFDHQRVVRVGGPILE